MRQQGRESALRQRMRLPALFAIAGFLSSGCTLIDRTAERLDHIYENRCGDGTGTCAPVVSLEPPQGYLSEGAVFTGAEITGPPGKTAVDRLVEMTKEVEELRRENESLKERLELAQTTIEQQADTIDSAGKELQLAMNDYALMRDSLAQWQNELKTFEDDYRDDQEAADEALDELERQLQEMIRQCESGTRSSENHSSALLPLVPPLDVSLKPGIEPWRPADSEEREPALLPASLEVSTR